VATTLKPGSIKRFWDRVDGTDKLKLIMYYEHTPEWWGQAIWFYNRMRQAEVPQDLFAVVENAGSMDAIPEHYITYTDEVLQFWEENYRLAEMLLPGR
jgi:hypothetical protein